MSAGSDKIFLVGNPNVGKSLIFGHLTGAYTTVSNYPGTTVTLSRGYFSGSDKKYEVIDTPGINSLIPMSEDERITRDLLLDREGIVPPPVPSAEGRIGPSGQRTGGGIVIQIADAKNLPRALPLTLQLQEMGVRLILVVNMCDEADRIGFRLTAKNWNRCWEFLSSKPLPQKEPELTFSKKESKRPAWRPSVFNTLPFLPRRFETSPLSCPPP